MTSDLVQRDLTRTEVEALPDGDLRAVLISAFGIENTGHRSGWDTAGAMPFQHLSRSTPSDEGAWLCPMVIEGLAELPGPQLIARFAELLETQPDLWDALPAGSGDSRYLALSIAYQGWMLPEGHTGTGGHRSPGDVPGSVEARFVRGICTDGTEFVVFRRRGQEPKARITRAPGASVDPDVDEEVDLYADLARVHNVIRDAYGRHDVSDLYADDPDDVPHGMTPAELADLPPSDLRDLALAALDVEEDHHDEVGFDGSPGSILLHRRHGPDHHFCHAAMTLRASGTTKDRIGKIMDLITTDERIRGEFDIIGDGYIGLSVVEEGWYHTLSEDEMAQWPGRALADIPGARRMRSVTGITRNRQAFWIKRVRGQAPVVDLIDNPADAARLPGDTAAALLELNALLLTLEEDTYEEPEVDAELDDLLPEEDSADTDMVMLVQRWRTDQPREGRIYPALPEDHRFADRPCAACQHPLGDGKPVQTYVLGTLTQAGLHAFFTGAWHDVVAALVHHRCIRATAAKVAHAASDPTTE